jgi:pimeloyl-ACP methyl ester carboxylesterase
VNRWRAALWTAGLAGGGAAGATLVRAVVRRDRGVADPHELEALAGLPPEDLGAVPSFDGTRLSVRAAGDRVRPEDPVLVFAHGFSLDMTMWHHQWTALSERYRCVLFDQRGHGRSERPPDGDYSLQAMGRDLRAILDLVSGPCVVVGHSMGGMSTLALAEAYPEEFGTRIRGVVLADTAAAEIVRGALGAIGARLEAVLRPRLRTALRAPGRAERLLRLVETRGADVAYAVARVTNFGPRADPAVMRHVTALSTRAPAEVWTDVLAGLVDMDLRHALNAVKVPALVVVGDLDRITPPASALALKRALPDARLTVMRGTGHLPMLERPRQFNALLDRFLQGPVRGSPIPAAGVPA